MAQKIVLSDLLIYPIKSAAGTSRKSANLTPRGLESDRIFMVVNSEGHFLTQRRFPKMALITPWPATPVHVTVNAPGMPKLHVMTADYSDTVEVEVWGDRVSATLCGPEAAAWFSQFLETPCQLVHLPATSKRPTDHGKLGPDETVSFADAYPYLLLSEASLAGLNQKLALKNASPVTMNRFRPNFVVSGDILPHAEDSWKRIRIGDATFRIAKPCARCSIPNVNQETGSRTKEPSPTLATYRAWDKGIWFGQNLIQENENKQAFHSLSVGDTVEILE
ncbi:MAG: MOSC N-terminal beta barrel domain-containing protein [Cyanobacteria bacterium P01_D01_bin.115]